MTGAAVLGAHTQDNAVRPFSINTSEEALADLRKRLAATRLPDKELVADPSQGVQLATMQALMRYWATDYDLRRLEARLNALPQTIGYSLADSPAGLGVWMLDHDPDSYAKISHAFVDGQPTGGLTRERIVDNMTLYWLTSTATSAARLYWEGARSAAAAAAAGQTPPQVSLPAAYTVFPGEIVQAPRSWLEEVYPNLIYFNAVDTGGHVAAWEEPELFSEELRAAFRSLR